MTEEQYWSAIQTNMEKHDEEDYYHDDYHGDEFISEDLIIKGKGYYEVKPANGKVQIYMICHFDFADLFDDPDFFPQDCIDGIMTKERYDMLYETEPMTLLYELFNVGAQAGFYNEKGERFIYSDLAPDTHRKGETKYHFLAMIPGDEFMNSRWKSFLIDFEPKCQEGQTDCRIRLKVELPYGKVQEPF